VILKRRVKHGSWLILRLIARRLRERAVENEEYFSENKPAFGPKFQLGTTANTARVPTIPSAADCSEYAMSEMNSDSLLSPQLLF